MEHTKKMLLVEPSLIDKINERNASHENPKSRLDTEMQNILKSNDDDRKKWILYLQTLQRYLHFTREDRQSYQLPIITSNMDSSETLLKKEQYDKSSDSYTKEPIVDHTLNEEVVHKESDTVQNKTIYSKKQILSLIPKSYIKKGESLLDFLLTNQNKVHWNDDGTVLVDNNKISGSNIVDLVNDSLRPLKKSDPIGWEKFAKALKDLKVPLTYIGNPKRSDYINQLRLKSFEEISGDEEYSTPTSEKKYIRKLKKKIDWEKWTPY